MKAEIENCTFDNETREHVVMVLRSMGVINRIDIFLGIFVSILSSISTSAIMIDKNLRRKNAYLLTAFLCVGYFIHGIGIIIRAALAMHQSYYHIDKPQTQLDCFYQWICAVLGAEIIIDVSFLTAADRCIAVFNPVMYRKQSKWWWIGSQLLIVSVHIIFATVRHATSTSQECIPLCVLLTAVELHVAVAMMIEFNIIVTATLLIYIFLIVWAKWSIRKVASQGGNAAAKRKQLKWKLIVTFALNVVVYTLTMFTGNTAITTAGMIEDYELAMLLLKIGTVDHLSGLASLCVLFFRIREFRHAVLALLRLREAATITTSSSRLEQTVTSTKITAKEKQ
ncbi:7TM GPCR Srsx domain containing protein [Trichuris trichiura]|uniref:7TM GPCR Srsx domain containing protein n=1 Tax=Trichuris trichiura TaxID=36087 RepID=A0A077YXH6_TRITR|nr:7TM GPCR Srsx domain containing protein [Trichuris trichiura]